jgi:hypothetical protein
MVSFALTWLVMLVIIYLKHEWMHGQIPKVDLLPNYSRTLARKLWQKKCGRKSVAGKVW